MNREISQTRVAAIVVTFNRLADLKVCIERLRQQTRRPDLILVVNNGSTDGTEDWLRGEQNIEVVTQKNAGSAGGQFTGVRVAYEKGYDWFWCMDDDGIPAPNALEELMGAAETHQLAMVGPMVIEKDSDFMVFDHGKTVTDARADAVEGLIDGPISFNGMLFNKDLVRSAGNVKKEMFIWGDDVEYCWRAQKSGFRSRICATAEHRHPADKLRATKVPLLRVSFKWIPNEQRRLIYFRNMVFLSRTYRKLDQARWIRPIRLAKDIVLTSVYSLVLEKFNIRGLWKLYRYCWDGFTNRYSLPPSRKSIESMLVK